MLTLKKSTIASLRLFGRKTNPIRSEKLKAFNFLILDSKKLEEMETKAGRVYMPKPKIEENVENIDAPLATGIDLFIKTLSDQHQALKDQIESDDLIAMTVKIRAVEIDGEVVQKYKISVTKSSVSNFIKSYEIFKSAIEHVKMPDREFTPKEFYDFLCNEYKEDPKICKALKWAFSLFINDLLRFVFIRRSYKMKGIDQVYNTWHMIGQEDSLAAEQYKVAQEFGILPFSVSSAVTEIQPR